MSGYGSLDRVNDSVNDSGASDNKSKNSTPERRHRRFNTGKPRIPTISIGVAYDINKQPISVNTFGSVLPDVNSEVDLNTTSETDVEDRKKYEPNILERALEHTLCYNPRRRARASNLTIGLLCIMTILSNAAIIIILPIYTASMRRAGGDESVALLSLAAVVPAPLILITLMLKHAYDKSITLRPAASLPQYTIMGVSLALRLNMGAFASHPERTPPSLQSALSGAIIPFAVISSYVILKKDFSKRRLTCCFIAMVAMFVGTEPRIWSLDGSEEGKLFSSEQLVDRIMWPIIFSMSYLPLAVYNAVCEKELKKNVIQTCSLTTSGLLSACVFTVLLSGLNFLPWYGHVDDWPGMWDNFKTGFRCNFSYAPDCQHCLVKLIVLGWSVFALNLFSLLLVSATEGSVFASVVGCLSAPLATAFWSLFHYDYDSDVISWRPGWTHTSAFTLASASLLLPAVVAYNVFAIKDAKAAKKEEKGYSDVSSSEYEWD